ncbi:MAG: amidohydrolase [Nocardioidaceae bacterium]|nr:amidohydrolase [Nocardioidaceae bacterium]
MPEPAVDRSLTGLTDAALDRLDAELVDVRRDLHAHPERSWHEERTTTLVADRLAAAGVRTRPLADTGLVADLGPEHGPVVVLRADLDALPVDDLTDDPWRSTTPGTAHACGHDVHTTGLLGAGLALASVGDRLPGRVRLVFQPAEEVMPGGALRAIEAGVLEDAHSIYMLHCDPTVDLGSVGLREGPITGAADFLSVTLTGGGGHTSRPHLTQDLTFALGKLVTELPAALSRRLDPRAGASLVWGVVRAGAAANVIPAGGLVEGTVRMLDAQAWSEAESLVRTLVDQILAPYGVHAEVGYVRGVPPVVNDPACTTLLAAVAADLLGPEQVQSTAQSLGGEDFAWYLEQVPGAMARLGTRTPGGPTYDLHQGNLRVDERAVGVGARLLARLAIAALV